MSSPRRLRGKNPCCGDRPYWDSPYVIGAYSQYHLAGILTEAEKDAISVIEGGTLWSHDSAGNRTYVPKGLPEPPEYRTMLAREAAAFQVIASGWGERNAIADTWPMPLEWYRTNGTPANTALRKQHTLEKGDPMGGHRGITLWCAPCKTAGEEFLEGLEYAGEQLTPVFTGIAMAISYIPVVGTAVSFIITATISLAQGKSIDQAMLDGIGNALPGQPMSGMAFNAVRAIASGKRLDGIAIAALPIPESTKEVLVTAIRIFEQIADGEKLTDITMNEVYNRLPPAGKEAMGVARRVINGDPIERIAMDSAGGNLSKLLDNMDSIQAMQVAAAEAKRLGPDATRSFIVQAGYQGAVDTLPSELQAALTAGLIGGRAEVMKVIEMGGFTLVENNTPENDQLAAKGQAIINSGARWHPINSGDDTSLFDIRNKRVVWTTTIYHTTRYDPVSTVTTNEKWVESRTDTINDNWRRGFDIGIGLCQGMSEPGPGQYRIRAGLTLVDKQRGFDAAQKIQYDRTVRNTFDNALEALAMTTVKAMPRSLSPADVADLQADAATGKSLAETVPAIAAARALNNDPNYRWGFDVAVGFTSGIRRGVALPTLEGQPGFTVPGPGQTAYGEKLLKVGGGPRGLNGTLAEVYNMGWANKYWQGWLVGQALMHGINKVRNSQDSIAKGSPNFEAGQLATLGLAGSGLPGDQKAAVMSTIVANGASREGAAAVVATKKGFWTKLKEFFGLG